MMEWSGNGPARITLQFPYYCLIYNTFTSLLIKTRFGKEVAVERCNTTSVVWQVHSHDAEEQLRELFLPSRELTHRCLLPPSAHLCPPWTGSCRRAPGPTACRSSCSPSHTTGPTTRRRAAAGPSRRCLADTPSYR